MFLLLAGCSHPAHVKLLSALEIYNCGQLEAIIYIDEEGETTVVSALDENPKFILAHKQFLKVVKDVETFDVRKKCHQT